MALFEEITYGIQCDVCGKLFTNEHSGFSLFVDKNQVKEEAQDYDWFIEKEECYCPDCYEIDDNDNIKIKEKK